MKVEWKKCTGKEWCELYRLNTSHDYFQELEGVFIIWYINDENDRSVLVIGSGNIASQVNTLKEDAAIRAFESHKVFVTWTIVPPKKSKGVTVFLHKKLQPMISNDPPKGFASKVNLPW